MAKENNPLSSGGILETMTEIFLYTAKEAPGLLHRYKNDADGGEDAFKEWIRIYLETKE